MSTVRKAIIIGGGPIGLATALRLQQNTNIQCTVYELRPEPSTLGGAIGILSNGLRLLDRLGVYETLYSRGNSSSVFTVHSTQGGVLGQKEDTVSHAREATGYGYMRIKRTDLIDVMMEASRQAEILVKFGKRLTKIDDSQSAGIRVEFSDGTTDTADLLLGCDGIHSMVRKLYVDPDFTPAYTGISGLFSIIPTSNLPSTTTSQLTGFDVTLTEDGMFAAMKCTANLDEVYWGFSRELAEPVSEDSRDGWEVHGKEEVGSFKATLHKILEKVHGNWGNALGSLVDSTASVKFYPVYELLRGGVWSRGRCLLLGDAAHAMPPHAGQGVSMGMEDVFLLSRLLKQSSRSLGDVFEQFDKIRRPRVDEIHSRSSQNGDMRRKTGSWGLWMKEVGIRIAFLLPWGLGTEKMGLDQKFLVYDIDEAQL